MHFTIYARLWLAPRGQARGNADVGRTDGADVDTQTWQTTRRHIAFNIQLAVQQHMWYPTTVTTVRVKKVAPKVFANFSETTWNFNIKFYRFILRFQLRSLAK